MCRFLELFFYVYVCVSIFNAYVVQALVGLSRCDTVKQIISKLPLFNNAQLQRMFILSLAPMLKTLFAFVRVFILIHP
jgi:hypothetical protein